MSEQTSEKHMSTADLANAGGQANTTTPPLAAQGTNGGEPHANQPAAVAAMTGADGGQLAALLPGREADDMRARWNAIQIGFVDDPRHAVEMADALVAEIMQRLAQLFANQRGQLEGQWSRGEDVSTEDLRQALRQYRSFFDRLLSI